jgi:hypothetical protein
MQSAFMFHDIFDHECWWGQLGLRCWILVAAAVAEPGECQAQLGAAEFLLGVAAQLAKTKV